MQAAFDQFFSFVASERTSHWKRLRFAGLMCILISILLYRTEWIILRPGLLILLAGQAGVAIALFLRNSRLGKTLGGQKEGILQEHLIPSWFEGERSFVRRLTLFETACQMAGFLVLGYEFWLASSSLWLALAIGVIYPAAMYFGINRRRNTTATRQLLAKEQKVDKMLANANERRD